MRQGLAPPQPDCPLLVVSGPLPPGPRGGAGTGSDPTGVAALLEPVLRKRGGVWVGWMPAGGGPPPSGAPFRLVPVTPSPLEVERALAGAWGRGLHPVFHGFPGRARFASGDARALRALCRRTARAVLAEVEGDPVVWLHEPALAPAAQELRRLRPDLRLVLSCHVPFPSEDVLRTLPWAPALLEGLLSCDVLDFATDADARRFLDAARWILGAEACPEWRRVTHAGRITRVLAVGAGVDVERLEALAGEAAPARPGGPRRLLAVDPLDATRGIPRRLAAFERLLERHPEWIGRVVLEQIVLPEPWGFPHDAELARRVHEHIGQVNGRFGTPEGSPVQYRSGPLGEEEWAALARDADVGWVTPLREGTATAAHRFVACRVGAPGALVLSSLSGGAETLREAVRVNPFDTEAVARAVHRALRMGPAERRARMARLRRRERERDVHAWACRVLAELADPAARRAPF